jgi:Cdc6-like AAA superfamily ATPase
LILKILKNRGEISSGNFYDIYRKEADEQGLKVKSHRSFNNYLADLIELNYVKVERAKTRGNVRLFRSG